jgi:putative addiction module component (TIGR02574 family)
MIIDGGFAMNNQAPIDPASHETTIVPNIISIIHRPVSERVKAIEDIWASITLEPEAVDVPQWHREELRRRIEIYQSKPKTGSSWPEARQRIERNHQSTSHSS